MCSVCCGKFTILFLWMTVTIKIMCKLLYVYSEYTWLEFLVSFTDMQNQFGIQWCVVKFPRFGTNLPVSCKGHQISQIKVTCDFSCALARIFLIGWIKFRTRHNQSEALPRSGQWRVISKKFLRLFLRCRLAGKPVVASRNVSCFLGLRHISDTHLW